jgi:cell division protein FtsQ
MVRLNKTRILNLLSWLLLMAYLVAALGFAGRKQDAVICSTIDVIITDSTYNYFVEKEDIINMINGGDKSVLGKPLAIINTAVLESLIYKHPSIKHAEVYTTMDGHVRAEIEQRNPIIRIINYNGESYYIDEQGALMPLSQKYTARVLVASGNINEPFNLRYTTDLANMKNTDEIHHDHLLYDLYELAKYVWNNKYWKSMIEQIYVNENKELEMIPKVGKHVILLGDIRDLDEKMNKLKIFYEKGLIHAGWDKYDILNLKYKNQVVCTKNQLYEPKP